MDCDNCIKTEQLEAAVSLMDRYHKELDELKLSRDFRKVTALTREPMNMKCNCDPHVEWCNICRAELAERESQEPINVLKKHITDLETIVDLCASDERTRGFYGPARRYLSHIA